uniref:Reverse transcriptase domain-containing protein n=1 Tax=Aegilops tauschii subsp. strangulata TaxID=200361 RepID=A0A453LNF1_AEGTS
MLKIDLAKAFDRLEWSFIVSALARKGLHDHFINLIHACISSPTFSVLINGQPSHKFKSSRGIRQGCPMSPYLFVIAINE